MTTLDVVKALRFSGVPDFTWDEDARIVTVPAGSKAEKHGIKVGWRIVEIGIDTLRCSDDSEHTRYCRRIAELIKSKSDLVMYTITFSPDVQVIELDVVDIQEHILASLDTLSQEKREENLQALDQLNQEEKVDLLHDKSVCNALLSHGWEELSVLTGEKSASWLNSQKAIWSRLQAGVAIDAADFDKIDLEYTDSVGDTALHLVSTPEAAALLMDAAIQRFPKVFEVRNNRGELPLEAVLRRVKTTNDRATILDLFSNAAPHTFILTSADGGPMGLLLKEQERKLLPPISVPWSKVSDVLLSEQIEDLQRGYAGLVATLCAEHPDISPDDHVSIWSCLVLEHCFGGLHAVAGESGASSFNHTATTKERLQVVWHAAKMMLDSSVDESVNFSADLVDAATKCVVECTALKGILRGLLSATMGPNSAPFDPREPYREEFVRLVKDLQECTAARLIHNLDMLRQEDPEAWHAVANEIPFKEIHGLDTSGAESRKAPERLRLDAKLLEPIDGIVGLATPKWVLAQQLDLDLVQTLKASGCIEKAGDLVELVSMKSNVLSPGRIRFACLHIAWVWTLVGKHLIEVCSTIKANLGLKDGLNSLPLKGSGDFIIRSFRARSEPKSLSRFLEKSREALEEEVAMGNSSQVLNLEPDLSIDPETATSEQLALQELLTPGCFVCDLVGAEVSVGSYRELLAMYRKLRTWRLTENGCQVVRTKNGFSKEAPDSEGGYRDLKVWIMVACNGTTIVAELQIHLSEVLEQKKYMHLAYECFRGSFDHFHLHEFWQPVPDHSNFLALCAFFRRMFLLGGSAKVSPEATYS